MVTHADYFTDQAVRSNPEFWRRFGRQPELDGKQVLDLGCGHGAMSLQMAEAGAHVLGVDLHEARISWAKENLADRPVRGSMLFRAADITKLIDLRGQCDLIVSKDSFEHIEDLPGVLAALRDALAPRGEIWAGFSPLYYSPWGGHGRTGMRGPWAHTLPRPVVYRAAARYMGHPVADLNDIGLNGLTPKQFRQYVADTGLRFESLACNRGDKRLLQTLDKLRRYRPLERYATVSIYAVLSRASHS